MGLGIRYTFDTVRSLDNGSIGGAYMGVGTALQFPAAQIFVQNLTNGLLMFSFDGVNDHFPLPANGFFLSDITSNRGIMNVFNLAIGERLYVKALTDLSTGTVYFSVMYAFEG